MSCSCLASKVDWAEEQDVYLSCCGGACSLPKVCGKIDFFVTKKSSSTPLFFVLPVPLTCSCLARILVPFIHLYIGTSFFRTCMCQVGRFWNNFSRRRSRSPHCRPHATSDRRRDGPKSREGREMHFFSQFRPPPPPSPPPTSEETSFANFLAGERRAGRIRVKSDGESLSFRPRFFCASPPNDAVGVDD